MQITRTAARLRQECASSRHGFADGKLIRKVLGYWHGGPSTLGLAIA
jgi:hypothetical protein